MLSEVKEAVDQICVDNGAGKVEIQENPKSPNSTAQFNVVVSSEDRQDLVNKGWTHRGIVGANIYFIRGGEEKEVKEPKTKTKAKTSTKKQTSRKK